MPGREPCFVFVDFAGLYEITIEDRRLISIMD